MKKATFKRNLFISLIVTSALPMLLAGGLAHYYLKQEIRNTIQNYNETLARTIADEVYEKLNNAKTALEDVGVFLNQDAVSLSNANDILDSLVDHSAYFETIYALDTSGKVISCGLPADRQDHREDSIGLDLSGHLFVREVQNSGDLFWSNAFMSVISGRQALSLSMPIKNGFLSANFCIESLNDIITRLDGKEWLEITLLDRTGIVLFHPDLKVANQQVSMNHLQPITLGLKGQYVTSEYRWQGKDYLGSVSQIPETGWLVLVSQTLASAYKPLDKIKTIITLVMVIVLVLVMIMTAVLSVRINRPIAQLVALTNRLADGSYSISVPDQRYHEFSQLAHSFISMSQAIRHRELSLAESEMRFRQLAENIEEVFWLVSPDWSQIYYVSPAFERIWGKSVEALNENPRLWLDCLHEDDRRAVMDVILNYDGRSTGPLHFPDYRVMQPDGSWRWIAARGFPVVDGENQIVRIAGLAEDITRRKEADSHREQFVTELKSKNTQLEQFTYTVSHDLKTPLITISSFVGMLEQDVRKNNAERIKIDMETIHNATTRMHELLSNLLELARIGQAVQLVPDVPMAQLVNEALANIEGEAQQRQVRIEVMGDMPSVACDPIQIQEVWQNLLSNAIKYMGSSPQPRIEVGCCYRDGKPVFYVKDNGIGIDPRYHTRIFKLFEQLDPGMPGTGIGLPLVKRIVEEHGGRIWVESAGKGQGTTFCFTLQNPNFGESESGEGV